jgi:glycosyltransferase involved in cell wall biosynthesis
MNIVGFILSRNNGSLIERAIKKCPKCINQIFISDDKSTDNTNEVAKKNGVKVFTNEKINGYGGNVKNALKVAFENFDADYAVEIHGDGAQFHPDATYDAIKIIDNETTKPDLILGSRFLNFIENMKMGYPLERMVPNYFISGIEKILLNIKITDFHQGFRVYSKNFYKTINLNNLADNYLLSFEVILHAKKNNLQIREIPVICDYKSDHTSHKLFGKNSAFTYQLETFNLIYKYFRNKL